VISFLGQAVGRQVEGTIELLALGAS